MPSAGVNIGGWVRRKGGIKARTIISPCFSVRFCYNEITINSNLAECSSLRGSNATAAIRTIRLCPNIYFRIASPAARNDGLDIISLRQYKR